jgi:uncharacterized OB-fold protein
MTGLDAFVSAAAAILARDAEGDDPDLTDFRRRLLGGRLSCLHCDECGYVRMPGSPRCPECLATGGTWREDAGAATVWSFAVYHRAFAPELSGLVPYVVALVDLDSGPRTITNVVGVEPADVRIGMRGTVRAVPVTQDQGLIYFIAED